MPAFRIGPGVFTPRLVPSLLTLCMFCALLGLGSWQVARLHWKVNLIATIKTRMAESPVDVAVLPANANIEYRPAQASGLLQHDKTLFLIAVSKTGEGGYHVLTPLQLDNGKYLLIDRGWIPYDHMQGRKFWQPVGPVVIKGIVRVPHHRWLQPADKPAQNLWYGVDLNAMAGATGVPQFLPFYLEADAAPNPDGYPIGGQTRITLPNNHLGYAITWYGLALALVIIYGLSGWKRDGA